MVVVNDVVTTGASLEPLLRLATERRARVAGVLVFGTLDERRFHRFLSEKQLPGTWLVSANSWGLTEAARCTQCADATEVIEASEFN